MRSLPHQKVVLALRMPVVIIGLGLRNYLGPTPFVSDLVLLISQQITLRLSPTNVIAELTHLLDAKLAQVMLNETAFNCKETQSA